jgi:predicted metal-dependent phosphoesterase TrpH
MPADLHLHSIFSDGTYTPEEIAAHAHRHGLTTLALTDHDTVEGCARMAAACEAHGLGFIPGTELTAECDDHELHLLGYFIDTTQAAFLHALERFQQVRQQRIHEMARRLNGLGIPLRAEAVFALANCRSPGRPHVGRALVQAGFCASLEETFERFLKKGRPAWVPKFKISAAEAIELIHGAGGLAVMAHPGLNRCDDLIPRLVAMGMDGIECVHTKHTAATAARYQALAQQHGLLITGGSDCHGLTKGKPLIGSVKLPDERIIALHSALARAGGRLPAPAGTGRIECAAAGTR